MSTRSAYTSAQNKFLKFCTLYGLVPVPVHSNTVLLYIAYMHTNGLSPATMSVYLSAIRSLHVMLGHPEPLLRTPQVKLALKAVKDSSSPAVVKSPIVYDRLKSMLQLLQGDPECILWSAVLSLAFFAGLRGAEYASVTVCGNHYYPKLAQVTFDKVQGAQVMYYTVAQTKTQVHGYRVPIGCTGVRVCAYCMMYSYLKDRFRSNVSAELPLFMFANGKVVTKNHANLCIKRLVAKLGLDVSHYSTRSIRSGAASTAASMGFRDWEIMRLGGGDHLHTGLTYGRWTAMWLAWMPGS